MTARVRAYVVRSWAATRHTVSLVSMVYALIRVGAGCKYEYLCMRNFVQEISNFGVLGRIVEHRSADLI